MDTKRVNFNIEAEKYAEFQKCAAKQGLSVTQVLRNFIESIVNDEIPADYEEQISSKISAKIEQQVDQDFIEVLATKVAEKLRNTQLTQVTQEDLRETSFTQDTQLTQSTQEDLRETSFTQLTQSTQEDLGKTQDTQVTQEDLEPLQEEKPKRDRSFLNSRTYSHADVALQEDLNNETVRRYSLGKRQPKDGTFFTRWGVCPWDSKRWIKVAK